MSWFNQTLFGDGASPIIDFLVHHHGALLALAICYVLYGTAETALLMLGKKGRLVKVCRFCCHAVILIMIFTVAAVYGLEYSHAKTA